jgi:hypothetical protein
MGCFSSYQEIGTRLFSLSSGEFFESFLALAGLSPDLIFLVGIIWDPGGPDGDRTHDLRIANAALSQLSYQPMIVSRKYP